MNKEEFEEFERLLNRLGIKDPETKHIAAVCDDIVCDAEVPVEGVWDEMTHNPRESHIDPRLFGLVCGIMYERKYIARQMKKQGLVLVGLDH